MSTEPKLGTCDRTLYSLLHGCPYSDSPHTHNKFCVNWREGESAAAQPPAQVMAWKVWQVLGAIWGIHTTREQSRICNWFWEVAHGERIDYDMLFPLKLEEAVPPAAETAMTAEQFYKLNSNFWDEHRKGGNYKTDWELKFEFAEAYAAHVREAAQGEIDLYALLRGICEEVIDWLATLSYDCIDDRKSVLDHPLSKDIRIKLQQMYDHPLDNKLLIRTDQIEAKLEKAETAKRRLAELGKALRDLVNEFQLHLPNIKERESLPLSAALASLRAESKEPVD